MVRWNRVKNYMVVLTVGCALLGGCKNAAEIGSQAGDLRQSDTAWTESSDESTSGEDAFEETADAKDQNSVQDKSSEGSSESGSAGGPQENAASRELEEKEKEKQRELGEKIDEYVEKAMNYMEEGKTLEANALLDTAESLYGDTSKIRNARYQVEKMTFSRKLEEAQNAQDYAAAMKIVNDCSSTLKEDEDVIAKTKIVEQYFVADSLEKADQVLHSESVDAALEVLSDALILLPTNEKLIDKRREISKLRPLPFALDSYIAKSNKFSEMETNGTGHDIYSNAVNNVTKIAWSRSDENDNTSTCTLSYKLTGEYDKLTGYLYLPFSRRKTDDYGEKTSKIEVWGDGNKIGEAYARNTEGPVEFSFFITEVNVLELKFTSDIFYYGSFSGCYSYILLSDVCLEKNY